MRARQVAAASAHCVCSAEGRGTRRAAAHTVGAGGDARTVVRMQERTRIRRLAVCARPLQGWAQRCCTCAGTGLRSGPALPHPHQDWAVRLWQAGFIGGRSALGSLLLRTSADSPEKCAEALEWLRSGESEWCTHAQCFMLYAATCRIVLQHVASCCNIVRHVALDRLSVQLRGRATRKRPSRSPRSASPPELPTETPTRRSARSGSAWPSALPAA
jgi:hypothetical protein